MASRVVGMPEISRFFGIVISMYFNDHQPPHFHACHGEHEGVIEIGTLDVVQGWLPPRVRGLVTEWAAMHPTTCWRIGTLRGHTPR